MRFTVRKVTKGWMVWDTASMKVAVVDDLPAISLSAETAKRLAEKLNSQHDISSQQSSRGNERQR
jgi:hypothetical protein